jgi:hypothetical protein
MALSQRLAAIAARLPLPVLPLALFLSIFPSPAPPSIVTTAIPTGCALLSTPVPASL